MARALLIGLCGLGDLILLQPTIEAFTGLGYDVDLITRQGVPRSFVSLLGDVAVHYPYPDDFIISLWTRWYRHPARRHALSRLRQEVRFVRGLPSYDVSAIAFPGEGKRGAVVSRLIGATRRMGQQYAVWGIPSTLFLHDALPTAVSRHRVDDNYEYARRLGAQARHDGPQLRLSVRQRRGVLGVHTGGDPANPDKRWSPPDFAQVLNHFVRKTGWKLEIYWGPGDDDVLPALLQGISGKYDLIKNQSLHTVSSRIGSCSAFLSSDTGLGHIADACGVPTLAVMTVGDPQKTAPYRGSWIGGGKATTTSVLARLLGVAR